MIRFVLLGIAAIILAVPFAQAQSKLKVGSDAPGFSNLPGIDDKKHSLSDFKKDVVVVVFTCNHCPIAVAYEKRIMEFTKKFQDKADVVAINVNNLEADKLPKMKERAKDRGFNFVYLYDESQKSGLAYGATVTPEFYVLGKDRKIAYRGAMDDSNVASEATVSFLDLAVTAVLEGKMPERTSTKARGCTVKYDE